MDLGCSFQSLEKNECEELEEKRVLSVDCPQEHGGVGMRRGWGGVGRFNLF